MKARNETLVSIALSGLIGFWSCASWKNVENTSASDPFERVELTIGASAERVREVLLGLSEGRHHSEEILARLPDLARIFHQGVGNGLSLVA